VLLTPVKIEKIFNKKSFKYFVWTALFSGAWGKMIRGKKPEAKNLAVPLTNPHQCFPIHIS
jgi:hypothetical protein